jgi:hypothetical protein
MKTYEVVIETSFGSLNIEVELPAGTDYNEVLKVAEAKLRSDLDSADSFILRVY